MENDSRKKIFKNPCNVTIHDEKSKYINILVSTRNKIKKRKSISPYFQTLKLTPNIKDPFGSQLVWNNDCSRTLKFSYFSKVMKRLK